MQGGHLLTIASMRTVNFTVLSNTGLNKSGLESSEEVGSTFLIIHILTEAGWLASLSYLCSVHVHSLHVAYTDHSLRSSRSLLSKVLMNVINLSLQALQDLLWVTKIYKISTSTLAKELMTPGVLEPAGPECQLYS